MSRLLQWSAGLGWFQVVVLGLALATAIELLTVGLRFGGGLESRTETQLIGSITFGIRVHHGYVGLLFGAAAIMARRLRPGVRNLLLMVGIGLFASDMVHHFLVLAPITGSPQFDLTYPETIVPSSR